MKINKLLNLVEKFREAIISCDKEILPATLKRFPHGSCGDASLLLGRFLRERNITAIYYVMGEKVVNKKHYMSQSHAWLKIDDLFIGITVDQFDSERDFIVLKNDNWYCQFNIVETYIADYYIFDKKTIRILDRAYENIVSLI